MKNMKFANWLFLIAGGYGLLVLLPQYFLEEKNGRDFPPAITHPEYYYGFVGVAVAFQVLFLFIAGNPSRYRAMMIPAVLEKASFGLATLVLYWQGRLTLTMLNFGLMDLLFGVLFAAAYLKTAAVLTNKRGVYEF